MPAPPSPIRVAVIGAGAFGRNHLRVYRELENAASQARGLSPAAGEAAFTPLSTPPQQAGSPPGPNVQLAALVDPDPNVRDQAAALYNIPAFPTVDDLLAAQRDQALNLTAASICVPTIHHAQIADQLLAANLDILIEKPFAATLDEADRIIARARERQRIVAIGHLERFNPAVTATLPRLNRPMFFEAHRLSIFTPRSLDVDVVLDLMIHDLDIVLALAQSEVREVRATGIPILSRKTDIANVRVEFNSGAVANFTASRVSTEQVRKLRLFQPHQYLSLDFARQELISITVDPALAAALNPQTPQQLSSRPQAQSAAAERPAAPLTTPAAALNPQTPHQLSSRPEAQSAAAERPAAPLTTPARGASFSPGQPQHPTTGFSLDKLSSQRAEPLRLELEDFLRAIQTRTPPRVPAEAGRQALALALTINQEIEAHAHRAGLR